MVRNNPRQVRILNALRRCGPLSPADLAAKSGLRWDPLQVELHELRQRGQIGFGASGSWADGLWFNVAAELDRGNPAVL